MRKEPKLCVWGKNKNYLLVEKLNKNHPKRFGFQNDLLSKTTSGGGGGPKKGRNECNSCLFFFSVSTHSYPICTSFP